MERIRQHAFEHSFALNSDRVPRPSIRSVSVRLRDGC